MRHFNPSKDLKTKNNTVFVGMYSLFYYICKQITKEMDNYQVFKVRLLWENIEKLFHLKNIQVKGLSYNPIKNAIRLGKDHKLHLSFKNKNTEAIDNDYFRVLPEIELKNGSDSYMIPHGYAVYDDLKVSYNQLRKLDIKINRIDYGVVDDKLEYYWRYVYPFKFGRWFLQTESLIYVEEDGRQVALSYLKPIIGNTDMHVFLTERNDNCYLVIQSGSKINSEEMYKRVNAITTTIGIITGNIFGDYHFQITSDDKDFDSFKSLKFGTLDDTRYSFYRIVNNKWVESYDLMNKYEYQHYAQEMLEKCVSDTTSYFDNKPVDATTFNNLVNLCYNNNDIAISASMLLEGSTLTIKYQPSIFHVALEAITSALMKNAQQKAKPIVGNDKYQRIVKPSLVNVLKGIKELSEEAKTIYIKKLESFNSPPNQDKLGVFFNTFGYILSDEDKKAIELRNYTFHGNLSHILKDSAEPEWGIYATALRLHKLCCILLLKAAGYTGRILNNEVILGVKEACERKEPPYLYI